MEDKIALIKEQITDILEFMGAKIQKFNLEYSEQGNSFGGNPYCKTDFSARINDLPIVPKTFRWNQNTETETDYINKIKSYMIDVLDGVANLS